jgi:hypothetical protein
MISYKIERKREMVIQQQQLDMNLNFILFLIKIKLNFFCGEMVEKKRGEDPNPMQICSD